MKKEENTASIPTPKLTAVRLTEEVTFFGLGGKNISATMAGIHLEWDPMKGAGGVVVVTSDNFPGEERWVFPATVAFASWKS